MKDKIEAQSVDAVKRVLGVDKLRRKFKQYEQKRQLCAMYDVFLADERVVRMLPHMIGKVFFQKKKHPITVNLTKKNIRREIKRALNATYLHLAPGACSLIKIGHTDMSKEDIVDNLLAVADGICKVIPRGAKNIQVKLARDPTNSHTGVAHQDASVDSAASLPLRPGLWAPHRRS